jgi:MFS family permease
MEPYMNTGIATRTKVRFFYGWWIVWAGFVVIAYGTGASGYLTHNIYSLIAGNASKTAIALTIYNGVMPICLLAIGPLIDRFGPRKLMLIGISIAGGALLGLGYANSLPYILLGIGILAIGMSAGFFLPVQTATANWFVKRRAAALAVVCAASVLGVPLLNMLGNQVVRHFSLQNTLLGLGVGMLAIGIPLAFVIRHRPEPHGYVPDGKAPAFVETFQPVIKGESSFAEVNYSLWQALRTRAFWILVIALGLAGVSRILIESRRSMYLLERGFHNSTTTNFSELASLIGLAWMLLFGFLGDRFSKRHLIAIAIALQSMSVIILINIGNTSQFFLYMLVYGLGSACTPLFLAIRADYFGRKAFAAITAVMGFLGGILSTGFSFLNQAMFGPAGNYQAAFLLSMFFGLLAAVTIIFAKPPGIPSPLAR